MATPVINNFNAIEYGSTADYVPSVLASCNLFMSPTGNVDITTFQYVSDASRNAYTIDAPGSTYLDTLSLTGAFQDSYYVELSESGGINTVTVYNESGGTIVASGTGADSSTITLAEQNSSGVSGSIGKNATTVPSPQTFNFSNTTVWSNASLLSVAGNNLTGLEANNVGSGRSTTFYWDIVADLGSSINADYHFRIQAREVDAPNTYSLMKGKESIAIVIQTPTTSISLTDYTNQRTFSFDLNTTGINITKFRAAETSASLVNTSFSPISGGQGVITWLTALEEQKSLFVEVSDDYFNRSGIPTTANDVITYLTTPPSSLFIQLVGSVGNDDYTGIIVEDDGSFTLTDDLTVNMYAQSLTSIEMYIDGDLKDGTNIRTWKAFNPSSATEDVKLLGSWLGNDSTNDVEITFRDEAGNTASISTSIRYNTKVYRFSNKNLREPNQEYDHQILEVTGGGGTIVIPRTEDSTEFERKWEDVYYPETHRYPTLPDGSVDETAAVALNGTSSEDHDAVVVSGGLVVYDNEGRVSTTDWTKDGTKDYENLESSYESGLSYFVLDNTGYGDFRLEFEYFYVDSDSFGPPFNNMAPYNGDSVVVYDASAPGAVQASIGAFGKTEYTLLDSTKLVELQAYTGRGSSVFSLDTGNTMNADTNGGFTTPEITTTSRICVVLYSDASQTASGFRIKAGPKHEIVWNNYNVDEENGLLWIHKYPLGNTSTNEIRAIYDYYETKVTTNYENGSVTFEIQPTGVVTADYTYYGYNADERPQSRTFSAYNDDFVDFTDSAIYVEPNGIIPDKTKVYVHGYPNAIQPSGKVTQYYSIDKDRGIIEFVDATSTEGDEFGYVPKGRLFADYNNHTYLRLSNDGFGNFYFEDETLVADDTPQYPDYSFGDIKVVNEGDAILEDGKMKFLPRGFDNNGDGTVDQVIDINRPWDIQQGSGAETYEKTSVEMRTNYTWNPTCTKNEAKAILSNGASNNIPDMSPEQVYYGRVIWVLGGTSGTSYPTTTTGEKIWSSEIEGKYYNIE